MLGDFTYYCSLLDLKILRHHHSEFTVQRREGSCLWCWMPFPVPLSPGSSAASEKLVCDPRAPTALGPATSLGCLIKYSEHEEKLHVVSTMSFSLLSNYSCFPLPKQSWWFWLKVRLIFCSKITCCEVVSLTLFICYCPVIVWVYLIPYPCLLPYLETTIRGQFYLSTGVMLPLLCCAAELFRDSLEGQ